MAGGDMAAGETWRRGLVTIGKTVSERRTRMTRTTPTLEEVCLGMEINMYFPAEESDDELS